MATNCGGRGRQGQLSYVPSPPAVGIALDPAAGGYAGRVSVDLDGRTALVTGAASGIGAACARRLAAAGAKVTVLDRDAEGAAGVAGEVGGSALVADLAESSSLDGLDLAADVLVNNAGFQHVDPVERFPPERFAAMVAVMLVAPFRLARAVLPGMYERGWGRVVNVSSVHGLRASPYKSAYVAAKHGLEGLSKVIALEGGPRGVTSNCICPAYVRTPLVEGQIADQARIHGISEAEVVERVMLTEPAIKRLVEPEEVAEVALFLCSPAASFVNGASLALDGGWTAR
jgi:3-hydroxybutyrate dehydrogenase